MPDMKTITIVPIGICADRILVDIEGETIAGVRFEGGCDGNGNALARLLEGMNAKQAAAILAGVDCEGKGTSCADQFAKGLARELGEAIDKAI